MIHNLMRANVVFFFNKQYQQLQNLLYKSQNKANGDLKSSEVQS